MSHRPIVFAGPSLLAPPGNGFALRPPAAAGDLLALADLSPRTIVLIDGVFDTAAAVQHKELLELLARGFRIIGGASMGALRAAEMAPFGMVGIGAIFAAYASGRITADDEVAVLHAPAELGHRALTEALVDIRATLAAAAAQRIITVAAARDLRRIAANMFWRTRQWPPLLAATDTATATQLRAWLPHGQVRLKALDARRCLAAALRPGPAPVTAPPPRTAFFAGLAAQKGVRI